MSKKYDVNFVSDDSEERFEVENGVIADIIKNMSEEECKQIMLTISDEDEFEGLVWQRQVRYEVDQWYGGILNKEKCICLYKHTFDNENNSKEMAVIDEIQEDIRK